ncbi:DEAD/DEAH box helicase [Nocardioides sp. REDSEA-S30_B4]|uniref:DEAD/DEAH box helicase n=1 Tax=Nocardioides sp. REDSEA-S30_B4 TaxID=1811552 RepID=UPI000AB132BE|nr:DEAD/DEAH box helicase [Nocardioides sp. REDSEA-S30_B4]
MGFVPVTGTATFRPAVPPRDSVVEFVDDRRTVALPVRAAIPVLTKAHAREDLDPSVALLSGAALLGMRLVAAGAFEPAPEEPGRPPSWRVGELTEEDEDRVRMLARSRAAGAQDAADAEQVVRAVLDAVADAVPRGAPVARSRPAPRRRPLRQSGGPGGEAAPVDSAPDDAFQERLQRRIAKIRRGSDLPHLVTISLRVEADEEELVAGSVRLVLQVHDERDPLHMADASALWLDDPEDHGFGDRARTHATIALRAAAEAWPVLDRLLALRVPDQIGLEAEEIASLLEDGVAALAERGVDVLWPRSLGRDLTTSAVLDTKPRRGGTREAPLQTGLLTPDSVFAFQWQVALDGDPLTPEEMDTLAASAAPVVKLRGAWRVVDPSITRKARKRLVRDVKPAEAVAAALSGVATLGEDQPAEVVVGASLLKVREQLRTAATREPVEPPAALQATLRDYQRHGLTWLAELTGLGLGACLADDMGLGKTLTLISLHLHRAERARAAGQAPAPTLVVCPTSLLGNWEAEIRRFAPGVPVRRFHGGTRSLAGLPGVGGGPESTEPTLLEPEPTPDGDPGFVLTTYGTMRVDTTTKDRPSELGEVTWGLVVADEAQHVKNSRSTTARGLRSIASGARVALTGTPVENDLTELWSILDWAIPGLLGSRQAFRRVWAAPIEAGTDHPLTLTREQVVLYEAFVRDTMERIERADEHTRRGLVLSLLTGCKQICNHPAHFLKQGGARVAGRSEKIDLLDELLGTVLAEDGAALVFTQYVEMARLVARHLANAGIPHQLLHGGTPVREREEMVRRFQSDDADRVPVFLLSLKAGGTGLNLTRADHVIHLDRWWNPAVEDQATDRAYRIGQTKPVQVHRMVTRGTIEERVGLLLERKRSLADAVLGRGEAALTELSDDELRDLVSLRPA